MQYPEFRIAVPLFFMISSFLFFSKEPNGLSLKKFILRNLILYFYWFILLLPFTVISRIEWFSDGLFRGILISIRELIFGSTFKGSWYISASILAITLVYILSKKIGDAATVAISVAGYFICGLASNYEGLVILLPIKKCIVVMEMVLGEIERSFLMAMFWVIIGKLFAARKNNLYSENKRCKLITIGIITLVLFMGLRLEHDLMEKLIGVPEDNSCYLSLIPLAVSTFYFLLQYNHMQIRISRQMRIYSTINYFLHCAVIVVLSFLFGFLGLNLSVLGLFILTALCTNALSIMIYHLSGCNHFKMLKHLY
jgi:surface polysaccharide O-acyltransferase-like enzyme